MTARTYANVKKGESKSMSSFKLSGTAKRLAAALLALIMVAGILPVTAAAAPDEVELSVKDGDKFDVDRLNADVDKHEDEPEHADDEVVRVSIVLDDPATIDMGYSTVDIAENKAAMKYKAELEVKQDKMIDKINKNVYGGGVLTA